MLKRLVLSTAISLVIITVPIAAKAADNFPGTQTREVVPFDWNGRYAGVQIGSAAQTTEFIIPGFGLISSANPTGITAGVLAGYNWSANNLLLGVEADANYANIEDSSNGIISGTYTTDVFASLRMRFGVTNDNLLVYGTAGGAYISTSHAANIFGQAFETDNSGFTATWGAGVEYAFDSRVTLRLEFRRYEEYGINHDVQQLAQAVLAAHRATTRMDVVTIGLTKFF